MLVKMLFLSLVVEMWFSPRNVVCTLRLSILLRCGNRSVSMAVAEGPAFISARAPD